MYSILNIRTLLIKITNTYMPDPPLAGAASLSFQYGEFVNKANDAQSLHNREDVYQKYLLWVNALVGSN